MAKRVTHCVGKQVLGPFPPRLQVLQLATRTAAGAVTRFGDPFRADAASGFHSPHLVGNDLDEFLRTMIGPGKRLTVVTAVCLLTGLAAVVAASRDPDDGFTVLATAAGWPWAWAALEGGLVWRRGRAMQSSGLEHALATYAAGAAAAVLVGALVFAAWGRGALRGFPTVLRTAGALVRGVHLHGPGVRDVRLDPGVGLPGAAGARCGVGQRPVCWDTVAGSSYDASRPRGDDRVLAGRAADGAGVGVRLSVSQMGSAWSFLTRGVRNDCQGHRRLRWRYQPEVEVQPPIRLAQPTWR